MRGPEINKPKLNRRRRRQRLLLFFSSRRRHARFKCDWSSDVCSSDLINQNFAAPDSSGTHAPTDQENQPEMPEREHAGAPNAVLARTLAEPTAHLQTDLQLPGRLRLPNNKDSTFGINQLPLLTNHNLNLQPPH